MKILLAHGSGGRFSHSLIRDIFLENFKNPILELLGDSATFLIDKGRIAYTTDSYVVSPIFFPGGDIGSLSVCGTINDLAMSGANPLYLSASFIIEEGLNKKDLERIVRSMKEVADEVGVKIVCGDTKVVKKGQADKVYITTSGLGLIPEGIRLSYQRIEVGDEIIVSGYIGDHGTAILSKREGLEFKGEIVSDLAPLNRLVSKMLNVGGDKIHAMRDPTRGGLATTLNEFAWLSGLGIKIYEEKIPIRDCVLGICELLGLDPLYIANEGKLIAIASKDVSKRLLTCMREDPYARHAEIIGTVVDEPAAKVFMVTRIGGTRIVDMLSGDQLPRIC